MTTEIPEPIRNRLAEIEVLLNDLGIEDANNEHAIKEAHQTIERAQRAIKESNDRMLIRGLEMTKLENERDTIWMVIAAFRIAGQSPEPRDPEKKTSATTMTAVEAVLRVLSQASRSLTRHEIKSADEHLSEVRLNTISVALNQLKAKRLVKPVGKNQWVVQ
jgi:hypothetical protein